jgi:hypothetical protein
VRPVSARHRLRGTKRCRVIDNVRDRLRCDPRTIVGDADPGAGNDDLYDRRDAGLLASIEPVVEKLLNDGGRPVSDGVASLVDEFFLEKNSASLDVLKTLRTSVELIMAPLHRRARSRAEVFGMRRCQK